MDAGDQRRDHRCCISRSRLPARAAAAIQFSADDLSLRFRPPRPGRQHHRAVYRQGAVLFGQHHRPRRLYHHARAVCRGVPQGVRFDAKNFSAVRVRCRLAVLLQEFHVLSRLFRHLRLRLGAGGAAYRHGPALSADHRARLRRPDPDASPAFSALCSDHRLHCRAALWAEPEIVGGQGRLRLMPGRASRRRLHRL